MLKKFIGVIISILILILFYFSLNKYLNKNYFNLENLHFFKKEGYINLDESKDQLQQEILKTNYFIKKPQAFNPDSSFFSFLSKFDPCFKPPEFKEFPFKSSLFKTNYNCRPTTTGMFTDCGPLAPNSCPK